MLIKLAASSNSLVSQCRAQSASSGKHLGHMNYSCLKSTKNTISNGHYPMSSKRQGMSNDSYIDKKKMVAGYETLIAEIMENENAESYYVSFMFNHLPGRQSAQIEQMWKEVTRFHGLLKRHVVRKPEAPGWRDLVPVLIGVPDYPVPKRKKVRVRSLQVNNGLHF